MESIPVRNPVPFILVVISVRIGISESSDQIFVGFVLAQIVIGETVNHFIKSTKSGFHNALLAVEEKENGKTWTRTVYRGAKVVFQRRKCCILVNLRKKTEREPLFSLSKTVPDKLFIRETVDTRGLKA